MLSRLSGIAVLTLWAGLLLATPAVQAASKTKTVKGTFNETGEVVSIGSSFSFDSVTVNNAGLVTFSGSVNFPTDPSLNGPFSGQGVNEFSADISKPCTFTGVTGEPEPANVTDVTGTLTLMGSAGAANGAFGSTFSFNQVGTGCEDFTDGAFTVTETDNLFGGPSGPFRNATGTGTSTSVGFTLAPFGAAGSLGFFQWFQIKKGKVTWQILVH